jgi:hypothetical protein
MLPESGVSPSAVFAGCPRPFQTESPAHPPQRSQSWISRPSRLQCKWLGVCPRIAVASCRMNRAEPPDQNTRHARKACLRFVGDQEWEGCAGCRPVSVPIGSRGDRNDSGDSYVATLQRSNFFFLSHFLLPTTARPAGIAQWKKRHRAQCFGSCSRYFRDIGTPELREMPKTKLRRPASWQNAQSSTTTTPPASTLHAVRSTSRPPPPTWYFLFYTPFHLSI